MSHTDRPATLRDVATAAQLDAAIQNYGLESRIVMLGAVNSERLSELYLAADIFVLASRFERAPSS